MQIRNRQPEKERAREKFTSLIVMLLANQPSESDMYVPIYNSCISDREILYKSKRDELDTNKKRRLRSGKMWEGAYQMIALEGERRPI